MAMLNFVYVLTGTDMQTGEWWTCGELKGNSSLMPIMETYEPPKGQKYIPYRHN